MITLDDFSKVSFEKVVPFEAFSEIERLVKELLKERDAFREVAIIKSSMYLNYGDYEKTAETVDAEAQRLMGKK